MTARNKNIHPQPNDAVCGIPETDAFGEHAVERVPWHYEQENVNGNGHYQCDIPGLELWSVRLDAGALAPEDNEACGHEEVEDGVGVGL